MLRQGRQAGKECKEFWKLDLNNAYFVVRLMSFYDIMVLFSVEWGVVIITVELLNMDEDVVCYIDVTKGLGGSEKN